ncbi:SDR family oxidoreductase [uncultured Eudoraea sp.]|uniref:SDR family oxidoreductase n=1 Tax=uncultured Eudoraea sp. TaxID=1035614 RepID=UPI00262EC936|nr:SDR family oxidoreductase [uncultured Eudoraea sp.]
MKQQSWALILGGSKGLGLATAGKLAKSGYNILIVHRDRNLHMPDIENAFKEISGFGVQLHSFNKDAIQAGSRAQLIEEIQKLLPKGEKIKVLVHSIAKGNLKPMNSQTEEELNNQDFQLTINAMAISLYDWTNALIKAKLFENDSRIIAFTSEGSVKAMPNYGAVGAAKAALEAIVRNMAIEFASLGLKSNCIQAGITDTESLRRIPGSEMLKEQALARNPNKRLTKPEDIADVVSLLCSDEAKWINGTVIKVDGGESLR